MAIYDIKTNFFSQTGLTSLPNPGIKAFMFTFLAILHVVVSVLLVLFILLQDPKGGSGGALGMLGGGGSKSLFGATGGNQFLVNITKWLAVIFAFTSIYLASLSTQKEKSLMDDYIPSAQENKAPKAQTEPETKTEPKTENKNPAE